MVFADMCSAPQIYKDQDPYDALGLSYVVTHWTPEIWIMSLYSQQKEGQQEGKGLCHRTCLFYEDFKRFSKRPSTAFCLCTWLLVDA